MTQCQLMRQTTTVGICYRQSREEGGEDVELVWLFGGCIAPHIQEKSLAMVWAVLYSGLFECVCSVVLCVNCWMDCGLPVAKRHLTENLCP